MATFASNSGRWATASRNLLLLFIVLLVFLKRSATCLGASELAPSANETSSDELNSNSNSNSNSNPNSMENSNNPNEANNQTLIINEDQLKFPLYMRLLATLACLVIFTIGVCGNLLVPLVVIKTKYLRNSTNLFLINLSIADLLVLIVCMPTVLIELHSRPETWLLGEPMCKVSNFVEMFAANGSIFTILAISFERYYAICKPLKAGYKCTRLRATIIIGLIWLLSTVLTSPILIMAKSSETSYIDGSLVHNCILETNTYWPKMYVFVSMFAFFCLPLLVLMLVYWLISRRLIRETIAGAAGSGGGGQGGDHCCNGSAKHLQISNGNNKSASVMVAECCCCPGETSHNNNNNNRTIRRKVQAGTKRTSISNLFSSFNHSQRNKNNNGQTNSSITLVGTDRRHRLFGLNKTLSLDHHHHHQHHQHQRPTFHAHQASCQQRPSSSSISTTVEMGRVDANVASAGTTRRAGQRTRPAGLLGRLLKFTGLFKLSAAIASSTSTSSSSSRRHEGGHTDHAGHTDRHDHSNHHDNLNVSINGFRSHEGQSNWRPRFKLVGRRAKPTTTTTTTRRRQASRAKYEPPEGAKQHAPEINGTGGALAASLDLTGLEVLGSGKQLDYDETFESAKVAADRVAKIEAGRRDKAADRPADSIRSTTGALHNQAKSNASNGHPSSPLPGLIHLANRNEAQQQQQQQPLEGRKRRRLQLRRQQQQTGSESQEQRVPSRPFRWCKGFSVSSAGGESSTYTNSTMLTTMANDDQAACSDEGGASLTARGAPEFEQKSPRSLWKHQYQLSSTSSGVDLSTSASIRRPKAANGSQQVAGDKRTAKKSAQFNGGGDYDEQVVDDDDENNNWRSASSNRRLISHQSGSCSRSSSIVISRSSSESNLAGDVTTTSFSKSNSSSSPDSMFHHERKTTMTTTEHHQQERRRILNRLAPGEAEPTSGHRIVSRFNSLKHDGDLEEEDQEEEQSDSLQARSGAQSTPFIRTELIDNEADPDDDLGRNERSMASAAADQGERASDESDEVFKRVKMICYVKGNVTNDKKLGRAPTSTASSASSSASSPSSSLSMADNFEGRDNDDAKIKLSPLSDNNQPNQIKFNPTEHRRISPSWGRENEVLVTELERKPLESPTNDNQIDEDEDDDESRPLRGERKPTTTTATTTTATTTTSGATKPEQANKMNSLVSMAQLTFEQNQCKRLQKRSGSQPIVSSHYHHQLMNHSSNHHHHNHHHHHHHHNHLAAQSDFQAVRDISKKQQMDSRRQVVIMLAFVVACFFLLFFPYRVFTIWLILSTEDQVQSLGMETYYNLTYFSRILIYLHSAINPIAYNLISTKFRQAFMSILLCRGPATRRHFTTEHQRFLQTNTYNHHHQHVTSSIVHKTGSNPTNTTNAGLLVKKQSLPPATHQQLTIVTK